MIQLKVIDDRGLDLDKQLLRSYYLKKSKKGRRFPPRTVGLWFETIIDNFREAVEMKNDTMCVLTTRKEIYHVHAFAHP